jgi:hypothetical protein
MQAQALVKTPNAKRYLGQFCKHFAHKLPAEFAADFATGNVKFGSGVCALQADDEALHVTVNAESEDDVLNLQDVAIRHLVRFAFREELMFEWKN